MPSISKNFLSKWRNYHLTEQGRYYPILESDPGFGFVERDDGTVRESANVHCTDVNDYSGIELLSQTGALLNEYIGSILEPQDDQLEIARARDLVAIGRGWSFSSLVAARDAQLDLSGLSGARLANNEELHDRCAYPRNKIALVLGGTRLRELTSWAQRLHNLSIKTSGTHLGMTIAGGAATASHGSRLDFGGIQDMIIGMHFITGTDSSVWIERHGKPVLSADAIQKLGATLIDDEGIFEDALIHLGGMGIVNGVAMQLTEDVGYDMIIAERSIDCLWLRRLGRRKYRRLAKKLGRDEEPIFYELTIDPHDWNGKSALHTMYFPAELGHPRWGEASGNRSLADELGSVIADLAGADKSDHEKGKSAAIQTGTFPSVYSIYRDILTNSPWFGDKVRNARWNQLHGDEITGNVPGALYNASYAINQRDLPKVIPLICDAVVGITPTFVFTIRIVRNSQGTIRFTEFEDCAVIEIDGISKHAPLVGKKLGGEIVRAAKQIRKVLDEKRIRYRMHWAKLGGVDSRKIESDFGPASDKNSGIARWRATRERLLADIKMRDLVWNKGLVDYGLVDRVEPDMNGSTR